MGYCYHSTYTSCNLFLHLQGSANSPVRHTRSPRCRSDETQTHHYQNHRTHSKAVLLSGTSSTRAWTGVHEWRLPVHYTTSTNGLQVGYPGQVGGHRGSKQCDRNHHSYPCHPVNGGYRIQKLRCLLILLFLYSYY